MPKLPGIQYTGVQSQGREDPFGPVRAARAESRALQSVGNVTKGIADAIYQENAKAEQLKAWNEYRKAMGEVELDLQNNQYTIDENTGERMPNYHSLPKAQEESERIVRENVLSRINNSLAKEMVTNQMNERQVQASLGSTRLALDWMRQEGQIVGIESIEQSIQSKEFQEARDTLKSLSNTFTIDQRMGLKAAIDSKELFFGTKDGIDAAETFDSIRNIRSRLDDPNDKEFAKLSPEDRSTLQRDLNTKVHDTMGELVHTSIQSLGLEAGEAVIQEVNRAGFEEYGFVSEDHKQKTLEFMRGVQANYRIARKGSEEEYERMIRRQEILSGSVPYSPDQKGRHFRQDRRVYDEIWRDVSEGTTFGTPQWNNALAAMVSTYGHIPFQAQGMISAHLHGNNSSMSGAAAQALMLVSQVSPHATHSVNEKDFGFASLMNRRAAIGVPMDQTFAEYTEAYNKRTVAEKEDIRRVFNANKGMIPELLDDRMSNSEFSGAWYQSLEELPPSFVNEFEREFEFQLALSPGNDFEVAADAAFAVVTGKGAWGPVTLDPIDFTSGTGFRAEFSPGTTIKMMKYAPSVMMPDRGEDGQTFVMNWVDEDFRNFARRNGMEPDKIDRAYAGKTEEGENIWYLLKNGNIVTDDSGMPMYHKPVWEESAKYGRIKDRTKDAVQRANAQMLSRNSYEQYMEMGMAGMVEEGYPAGAGETVKSAARGIDFSNELARDFWDHVQVSSGLERTTGNYGPEVYQHGTMEQIEKYERQQAIRLDSIRKVREQQILKWKAKNPNKPLPPYLSSPISP